MNSTKARNVRGAKDPKLTGPLQNWSTAQKHAALVVLAMESLIIKFSNTVIVRSMLLFPGRCHLSISPIVLTRPI